MDKETISLPKAARICAVSRWTLATYVKSGELNASRTPGGHYRIARKDLDEFLNKKGMLPKKRDAGISKKILVVDDDEVIRKLLHRALSGLDYALAFASDGFEAGIKITKFQPHLVFLDLFMPGMDGFKVCELIKNDPDTAHITVIAMSGFGSNENKKRILDCGADLFFPKPLDMANLKRAVETVLDQANMPRSVGPGR